MIILLEKNEEGYSGQLWEEIPGEELTKEDKNKFFDVLTDTFEKAKTNVPMSQIPINR